MGNAARASSPHKTTIDIIISVVRERLIAASMNPIISERLLIRQPWLLVPPRSGLPLQIRDQS